jgi:hypothetical protein
MGEWQQRANSAFDEIESAYLDVDSVNLQVPIRERVNMAREAISADRVEPLDAAAWRDDFVPTARNTETSALSPITRALPGDDPLIDHCATTALSILLDCLYRLPETPVEAAVSDLSTAVNNPNDRSLLATGLEATARVARSTGLCWHCLSATEGLSFRHPDASVQDVRSTVRESHEEGDISRIADLATAVDRSVAGKWAEPDLRGYTDESNSGEPFEQLLAALWLDAGYDEAVVVNDAGGDGGVDVVATQKDRIVGIEAKRYDGATLRAKHVRQLAGVLPQYDFDEVYLVTTTTSITEDAHSEASRTDDLRLLDGKNLAKRLSKSSLSPPIFLDQINSSPAE